MTKLMRVVRTLLCGHSSGPNVRRASRQLLYSLFRGLLRRGLLRGGFLLRYFLCRGLLGCTLWGCRGFRRDLLRRGLLGSGFLLRSFRGHSFLGRSRFLRRSRLANRRSGFACRLLGRGGTASFCRRRLLGHILFRCWFFHRLSPDVRHRHLFGSPSVVCPPWVSRLFSLGCGRFGWFGFNDNRLFHVLAFLAMLLFIGLHFDVLLFVYLVDQKSHAPCGLNKTIRDCFNRSHLDNTGADCRCKVKTTQNRGFLKVLAPEAPQTPNQRAQRNQMPDSRCVAGFSRRRVAMASDSPAARLRS